ncbi:MAG: CrcB family protein [Neomegalonema sp.]|nr:CrcB family protein [Neomegalonema sp.]
MMLLWVMAGGALGAGGRYILVDWASRTLHASHYGVAIANLLGSLLIGLLFGLAQAIGDASPKFIAFLTVGVLGGFTTFSTFSLDALRLLEAGRFGTAMIYMAGSALGGLAAAAIGVAVGRAVG